MAAGRMKKFIRTIAMTLLLCFSFSVIAFAAPPPWAGQGSLDKEQKNIMKQLRKEYKGQIKLNGKPIEFDVNPYEKGGRILIPLRAVAATLKAEVTYKTDGTRQIITVEKNKDVVKIILDSDAKGNTFSITLNGKEVKSDAYPELRNGRTFVPLRLLAVLLGLKVNYNGDVELEDDKEEDPEKAEGLAYGWYDFEEEQYESYARKIKGKLNKENKFTSIKFAVLNDEGDKLPAYEGNIPTIDYEFDKYMYIWGLGEARTGGYALYIDEISQLERVVWVKVHLTTPAADDYVTPAINYPYDLVRVRKADLLKEGKLTLIFLDQNNKELGKLTKTID
jgi:hypothetical protein